MDCSMPGLLVHHQLLEFTQTRIHWVSDVIQPSHPLSSPSPLSFNLSPHQGLFKWISSLHQVAKVLEFQLQHQSFQWKFRADLFLDGLVGSPCSPRDSQESAPTPQFKSINSLALSLLHSPTLTSNKSLIWRGEQDGGGVGGCGVHLSPWIHQVYTFRHRSACRTPAESGQEYLSSGK